MFATSRWCVAVLVVLATAACGSAQEKKNVVVIPPGTVMTTIESHHGAELLAPGSRVDVLGVARVKGKLRGFVVLQNVRILAIDTQAVPKGELPRNVVSFAVTREQAAVLALAKEQKCPLSLLLHHPDDGPTGAEYDIKEVTKFLKELGRPVEVAPPPRAK